MLKDLKHLPVQQEDVKSNLKGGKTGWPPGLLQDDCRALSKWFSTRLDARYVFMQNLKENK